MKKIITLIDEAHAIPGYEFVSYSAEECRDCNLYNVCIQNLREGRKYRITGVRNFSHSCKIFGKVVVVEVEEAEIEASLDPKQAISGAVINFEPVECERILCDHYTKCIPEGLSSGERVVVTEVREKIRCPRGINLISVLLKPK